MSYRPPFWAALSAGAALFIGCGILFAFQDLGTANDYATIASFFLALLTAAGSLLSFLRAKRETEAPAHGKRDPRPAPGLSVYGNVGGLQQGDCTQMDVTIHAQDQEKPQKRRR